MTFDGLEGSHSAVTAGQSLLGRLVVLLGKYLPALRRTAVPHLQERNFKMSLTTYSRKQPSIGENPCCRHRFNYAAKHWNVSETVETRCVLNLHLRGLLEKYPTFGREKETGLLGALDT